MQISTRLSIAVHILSLLGAAPPEELTSEFIAGSVGVNPVVIRNLSGMLKRAGLLSSQQGRRGIYLTKPLEAITLLDIYRAVETPDDLFSMHARPNPQCPVGASIQAALEGELADAQRKMEERLGETTVADVVGRMGLEFAS